jgi:hypothetical protein
MLTIEEKTWLKNNYPELKIKKEGLIKGDLVFCMKYNEKTSERRILNPSEYSSKNGLIKDRYKIEIYLNKKTIPEVKETAGRIEKNAKKTGKKIGDLHLNEDTKTACLCSPLEIKQYLPEGFILKDFFNNLLIPFFYAQSFFEINGRWPLWGEYSHGINGILESFGNLSNKEVTDEIIKICLLVLKRSENKEKYIEMLSKKGEIKGHWNCICGSGKKFRKCHEGVFRGLWRLKKVI